MIRISKPIVREVDRKVFLVSYMSDNKSKTEVNPNGEEVFYATTKDYGQYLTNESSDCFVVGILLMAIKLGQDIECDTISEKLYYMFLKLRKNKKIIIIYIQYNQNQQKTFLAKYKQ